MDDEDTDLLGESAGGRRVTGPQPIVIERNGAAAKWALAIITGVSIALASSAVTRSCAGCQLGTFQPPYRSRAEAEEVQRKLEEALATESRTNADAHATIQTSVAETRGAITQINAALDRIESKLGTKPKPRRTP